MNSVLESLMQQRRHITTQAAYLDKATAELQQSERVNNQAIELIAGNQGRTHTPAEAAAPARPKTATAARNRNRSRAAAGKKTPEKAMTAGAGS